MPSTTSSPHTLRLQNELWEKIDREAREMKMTRNEWMRRRLAGAFPDDPEVRKSNETVRSTNGITWKEVAE